MKKEEYLTTAEYAIKHGITRQWAHKLAQTGRIPAVRLGNQWFIKVNKKKND